VSIVCHLKMHTDLITVHGYWLALRVNYSANFYFKIALINRFKVYLIKIPTVMSKRKQKQHRLRLQCRIYLVNVT